MKTHLGHYEIVDELGRGGMGVVYRGFEPALNRHVAIKELSPSLAHDPSLVERFLREARSMASLNDPHIIQIYFIGTDEATGQPFFAMEFVEGDSLSGMLKREGKLGVETALKILHQTAKGLATAHDKGVIHRDLKPGNLMLTPRGNVKIADFGIALATQDFAKKLTSTGEFVGTPGYLSPEVCIGKTVDQRSDIFSLGIVLFEMLTGRVPFTEESPLGLMLEVVKAEFPDVRQLNGEVDAQAAAILAKMVAKEPDDRFQSCHDLITALEGHPLVTRPGTLKLSFPKPAADGATVVGAPTPGSQKQRVATPPPVVPRAGSAAPMATAASAVHGAAAPVAAVPEPPAGVAAAAPARPSVLDRSKERKSSAAVPLAIAAALVLLLGGGVFAMRGAIVDFARGFSDGITGSDQAYSGGVSAGRASNPVGVGVAAPVGEGSADTPSGEPRSLAEQAAAALETAGRATDGAATVTEVALEAAEQGTAAGQTALDQVAAAGIEQRVAAAQQLAGEVAAQVEAGAERPVLAALQQKAAAQREQIARATPPPPPAPPPRVVVIALGDSAITGPARQRIEERLMDAGIDVVDAEMIPGLSRRELAEAINAVRRYAAVAVVVRAEGVGSQELHYYGQSSSLYTVNLSVRAYNVSDRRALGAGFRERVDFTTLNADSKAEEAVRPHLSGMVNALGAYRRKGAG